MTSFLNESICSFSSRLGSIAIFEIPVSAAVPLFLSQKSSKASRFSSRVPSSVCSLIVTFFDVLSPNTAEGNRFCFCERRRAVNWDSFEQIETLCALCCGTRMLLNLCRVLKEMQIFCLYVFSVSYYPDYCVFDCKEWCCYQEY